MPWWQTLAKSNRHRLNSLHMRAALDFHDALCSSFTVAATAAVQLC